MQKVILTGNLGRDPEMRYTGDGTPVTNFSMAVNESWVKDGERQEKTTWFRVTCWRGLAETVKTYLAKGRKVLVEGRLDSDPETGGPKTWTGDDGQVRTSYEVVAMNVEFLDSRGSSSSEENVDAEGDAIPF
jgi:single-strand DNA-binding protein